jgi:N-acylglucosamine-6-phosphate 2-epimerase
MINLRQLFQGLIVSCQADKGNPLRDPMIMAALATIAEENGAVAIRANSPDDITVIKSTVEIPVIGIYKKIYAGSDVYITPTVEDARVIAEAGADIIALDATNRVRPNNLSLEALISECKEGLKLQVMADISTFKEAVKAEEFGADLISTTLSGYTDYSPKMDMPDFDLIKKISSSLSIPVVAEGRISSPSQAKRAIELGAFAVVVGSAITRPGWIISQYISRMNQDEYNPTQ